jgi:hypothetical protein
MKNLNPPSHPTNTTTRAVVIPIPRDTKRTVQARIPTHAMIMKQQKIRAIPLLAVIRFKRQSQ